MSRSGCVIVTCASFSASAKVEPETGGPVTGPVPKVGGAPAVPEDEGDGFCGSVRHAAAAAIAATGAVIRNCRRVFMRAHHRATASAIASSPGRDAVRFDRSRAATPAGPRTLTIEGGCGVLDRCSVAAALFAVCYTTVLADPVPFKTFDRGQ